MHVHDADLCMHYVHAHVHVMQDPYDHVCMTFCGFRDRLWGIDGLRGVT